MDVPIDGITVSRLILISEFQDGKSFACIFKMKGINCLTFGAWRSLVSRPAGSGGDVGEFKT